jgi:methyl-accepting chemotaxis protein
MKILQNLKIGIRIGLVLLIAAIGLVTVGTLGVRDIMIYDAKVDGLTDTARRAIYAEKINGHVNAVVMESRGIYMSKDTEAAKPFARNLLASLAEMERLIPLYEKTQQPDRLQAFQERKKHLQDFITFRRETARLGTEVGPAAANEQGNNEANRANRKAVNDQLVEAAARNDKAIDEIAGELHAFGNREIPLLIGLSAAITAISLLLGFAISIFTITRPLARINASLAALGEGDMNAEIAGTDRKDEIGSMARAAAVLKQMMVTAARAQNALTNVSTGVMVADNENRIVFCNQAVTAMLRNAEAEIRRDLPNFRVDTLVGSSIDVFHKNPAHQQNMLAALKTTHRTRIRVGGRSFDLVANPAVNDRGERVGTSVEWADITAQLEVEREVAEAVQAAEAGDFSRRLPLDGRQGFIRQLSESVNHLFGTTGRALESVADVIAGLSRGDLTHTINDDFKGLFGKLKSDVNSTIEKLRGIAGELNQSASAVKEAAAEISTGSQDLASRTESQAASIEETAASMHEITATVKQNADNAQAASQLAAVARDAANKGGAVMDNVVSAMGEIEGSATKISDIVGLIDEIAFQTNLLALNASVEAARAGEAGKGFAVVAQEVRALAQRSADASREIKTLITASNGQVREGGKLVTQAGESLTEIVSAVKKVTDIVSEIAAASREQATGLEQVNTAVGTMDEMTQRNGALVEETSASAQSLSQQASQLAQLVSFFRTGNAAQPVAAARTVTQAPATPAAGVTPLRAAADKPAHKPAVKPATAKPAAAKAATAAKPAAAAQPHTNQTDADWQEF